VQNKSTLYFKYLWDKCEKPFKQERKKAMLDLTSLVDKIAACPKNSKHHKEPNSDEYIFSCSLCPYKISTSPLRFDPIKRVIKNHLLDRHEAVFEDSNEEVKIHYTYVLESVENNNS
jgi:hypothetical protein